ncbi:hypothetical protein DP129_10850 [Clostridium tetani]|uniref:hypothetical protein n=1 Tax=Clostridium tetani TaxID=1513 RepID=UPI00100A5607|nr:hypothetical protein [Clostridium tetani]RXI38710.1 hypothetical protein DP129_10850 [Clostridium tetani]
MIDYIEIKEDVFDQIEIFLDNELPIEQGTNKILDDCKQTFENSYLQKILHFINIALFQINNGYTIEKRVEDVITSGIELIESNKFNQEFTEEDNKYINEDINIIKEYLNK